MQGWVILAFAHRNEDVGGNLMLDEDAGISFYDLGALEAKEPPFPTRFLSLSLHELVQIREHSETAGILLAPMTSM